MIPLPIKFQKYKNWINLHILETVKNPYILQMIIYNKIMKITIKMNSNLKKWTKMNQFNMQKIKGNNYMIKNMVI